MQKKKAISLIVLVITIIVMIVLAGAIILSLNNSGIIGKANQAVRDTDEATVKELAQMAWAEAYADEVRTVEGKGGFKERVEIALSENEVDTSMYLLNITTKGVTVKLLTKAWVQAKDEDGNLIVKKGEETLTIGQSVTYDEGAAYAGGWKVLGADEDGNLLIMSDTNVTTVKLGGSTIDAAHKSWISGASDITKAVQKAIPLETAPNAVSVRSIEVEDVDKITGYDKTTYGSSTVPYQYENTVTYTYNGTAYPTYTGTNGATGDLTYDHSKNDGFYWSDGKDIHHVSTADLKNAENNGKTIAKLTSNYYYYAGKSGANELAENSAAYKMLFRNGDNTANVTYWLASPIVYAYTGTVAFGMRGVNDGSVSGGLMLLSDGDVGMPEYGARAVVTLESDVSMASLVQ